MRRAGILNALERKYYPRRMSDVLPEQPSSVTLNRVQIFFVLLGTGSLLAALLLILEISVHGKAHNKRYVKKQLVSKQHYSPVCPFIN
jgi:hypothetical protein